MIFGRKRRQEKSRPPARDERAERWAQSLPAYVPDPNVTRPQPVIRRREEPTFWPPDGVAKQPYRPRHLGDGPWW